MCYDRTSVGRKPMCVSVCPSGALAFGPREEMLARRREQTTDVFVIGAQTIRTKVQLMVPRAAEVVHLDVTAFMDRSLDAASTEVEAHA